MIKYIYKFIQTHDDLMAGTVGGGGFAVMMTDINLILKSLVALATLLYFGVRIYNEFKK